MLAAALLGSLQSQLQESEGRPGLVSLSPKLLPVFLFPGESLPLALALFAFVGFMLVLVVVPFSVWKMGRLLRRSCCPVVVLPDTLVTVCYFPFKAPP